jgi:hypothetical protein
MNLTLFPFLQVSIAALLLLLQGLLFYMSPDPVLPIHFRMHQTHTQAQRIYNRSHIILPPYDTNFYGGVLEYYVSEIYVVRMFSPNPCVGAHVQITPNTHTKVAPESRSSQTYVSHESIRSRGRNTLEIIRRRRRRMQRR